MTKINELGQNILQAKYYAPGETTPEELFMRVAKVVSLADVLWSEIGKKGENRKIVISVGKQKDYVVPFLEVFAPYQETVKRIISRELSSHVSLFEKGWICQHDADRLLNEWNDYADVYFDLMRDMKFMPATPVLINAGRTDMLSSCFFLNVGDSIEEIFTSVKNAATIMKMGGGVGFDFSDIRPEGSSVSTTNGKATGPISYMKIINAVGDQISQGGCRKAAMMACLSVDHPDILKFIECKKTEGDLANFNISVVLTKEFMEKLDSNGDFILKHPKTANTTVIKAKALWNRIVSSAHGNGEPGILFGDKIADGDAYGGKHGKLRPNPCQPGFATVLTYEGIKTFDNISVGSVIWSGQRWTRVLSKIHTGVKPVYKYKTTAGEFVGTDNHRIVSYNHKIEVKDAETIQVCKAEFKPVEVHDPQDVMDGLMFGDGGLHKEKTRNVKILYIGVDDQDYSNSEVKQLNGRNYKAHKDKTYTITTTMTEDELLPIPTNTRRIPDRFFFGNRERVCGFLRGLYSANGSTNGYRITLKTTNLGVIKQVQQMLSSVGISSYYTTNKKRKNLFCNGEYEMNVSYDLNISPDREKFRDSIGFLQGYKKKKLASLCQFHNKSKNAHTAAKENYEIRSREYVGDVDVYDITVDADEHTYWTGGMLVSNCGELLLLDHESCALSCVNVSEFYHADTNSVDKEALHNAVCTVTRFLDNMVSVNNYPLPEIEKASLSTRRVGLGVTGFHDLMLKLGIDYGSESGVKFAEELFADIRAAAVMVSQELGISRGVPEWNKDLGRRNAGLLTCQPTGSVSMILNQVSSGIEPVYKFTTERTDSFGTHIVSHPVVEKFKGKCVPAYVKDAHGIPFEWHVKMVAAVQKYICSSIAKTINMSNAATVEDVGNAYIMAYISGCKSITVYRDGSRNKQVLSSVTVKKEEPPVVVVPVEVPKVQHAQPTIRERPRVLFGATFKVPTPSGQAYITINEDQYGIRELFVHIGRVGSEISTHTEAHGRLISNSLKYCVPIESMIAHLKDQRSSPVFEQGGMIKSAPDAIAKTLQEYIDGYEGFSEYISDPRLVHQDDNEEKPKHILGGQMSGDVCPDCGEMTVYSESGCRVCKNCGFSQCG